MTLRWLALCLACACSPTARTPDASQLLGANAPPGPATPPASIAAPEDSSGELSRDTNSTSPPPEGESAQKHGALVAALDIPDVPPPILVLPASTAPVPLLLGAHGAGGSPEWQCPWLSSLTATPTALLCLRGLPLSRGELAFYYPEHHSLGRWLAAALERVGADHGSRLAPPFIYVGYSQGATMGALAIQTAPNAIPHLMLVEGGLEGWTLARSRDFARAGGRKVYFACGTRSCNAKAERLRGAMTTAGLEVRVGYAEGAGHTPLGPVEHYVREGLTWLLEATPTEPQP